LFKTFSSFMEFIVIRILPLCLTNEQQLAGSNDNSAFFREFDP